MKKHDTIIITGEDLLAAWSSESRSAAEVAGQEIEPNTWYEVSWPDHVQFPRYNGDCSIREAELDDVIALGDGSLICDACLHEHYPGNPEPETGWLRSVCHYHRIVYKNTR